MRESKLCGFVIQISKGQFVGPKCFIVSMFCWDAHGFPHSQLHHT